MKEFGRRGQAKQGAVSTAGHGPSDGLPHPVVGIFLIPFVLGIGYGMGLLGQFQVTNFRTFHVATFFSASIMFGLCCGVTLRSARACLP